MTGDEANNRGFTLIEVLVALFVLSIALISIIRGINVMADSTTDLRLRVFGQWAALNAIEELRISENILYGTKQVQQRMGQQNWTVELTIEPAGLQDFARVIARSSRVNGNAPGALVTAYVKVDK